MPNLRGQNITRSMHSVIWLFVVWYLSVSPHMLQVCCIGTGASMRNVCKFVWYITSAYFMQLWMAGAWWLIDSCITSQWRHNDHDSVSNHQPHGCLLKRLYMRWSKKTSKLCVTGLCEGNSPGSVNSPHKGPVARKMFPFDDAIMSSQNHGPISRMIFFHRNLISVGTFSVSHSDTVIVQNVAHDTIIVLLCHGIIFSCDQAALCMVQSVCLSVCPSVTPFDYVSIIASSWNFQAALCMVQSVCLSVCPSVRPSHLLTVFPSSHHHEIFRTYYQWQKWRPCKK